MIFTILYSILAYFVLFLLYKTYIFYTTVRKIPSPPGVPLLGNLLFILAAPEKFFENFRRFSATYYPIYRLSVFFFTAVALLDPDDIELVLSGTKHLKKTPIYGYLKNWLGTGLLTSSGTKWHKRRKILTPAFHFKVLQSFMTIFNKETEGLVKKLEEKCGQGEFDIVPIATSFTLQAIGETAMGFKNTDEAVHKKYKDAVYKMGQLIVRKLPKFWFRFHFVYKLSNMWREEKNLIEIMHSFTDNIIIEKEKEFNAKEMNDRIAEKRKLAMLDLLLCAKNEGADIDREGIREEVNTFMFEGHDTTAMAISFLLVVLANHPEAQEKIVSEIVQVIGPTEAPTFNNLQDLKYTEMCIKETLRLFPSVPLITRMAGEDFTTKTGYDIPKGTIMHFHIYDIHRNPRIFPEPEKFDPERFSTTNCTNRHPFAYIPFSAGPRNCIGQRFAMLELKAALCGVLRHFILEKVDDMNDINIKVDLVLRPKSEIKIKLRKRLII